MDYFEAKWKENMTQNAAIKLGLEALRESMDDDLNSDTVEIACRFDGYQRWLMGCSEAPRENLPIIHALSQPSSGAPW